MTRSLRVDACDETVEAAVAMGRREQVGFILRIQEKKELLFNLNNGETEEIATTSYGEWGSRSVHLRGTPDLLLPTGSTLRPSRSFSSKP